jgi:hypothetical protein
MIGLKEVRTLIELNKKFPAYPYDINTSGISKLKSSSFIKFI